MTDTQWLLRGDYFETCNCDYLCLCQETKGAGVPARLSLITKEFAGIEHLPIRFEKSGMARSVKIGAALDQAIEGVPGRGNPDEPIYLDNTGHLASNRLALAKATRSHLHVFGTDWDDVSGLKNGHFAPFDWQGP